MLPDPGCKKEESASALLVQVASELEISLSSSQIKKFELYLAELKEWNKKINLTALKTDRDIISKHFIDSLTPLTLIPSSSNILDIGSGAGFPGIPLKIVNPTFSMILVEARRKKVYFLRHIIRTLDLKGIQANHLYLDLTVAQGPLFKEKFDVVISRAAFDLKMFLDLSFFLLKEKGLAIAMKGPQVGEEIKVVSRNSQFCAFNLINNLEMVLPLTRERRRLVVYSRN